MREGGRKEEGRKEGRKRESLPCSSDPVLGKMQLDGDLLTRGSSWRHSRGCGMFVSRKLLALPPFFPKIHMSVNLYETRTMQKQQ